MWVTLSAWRCGYNEFDTPSTSEQSDPQSISVVQLRGMYNGRTSMITRDYILTGYVSSSDKHGNFNRVLYIDDTFGGVQILTGLYDTYNYYKYGQMVHIHLKGLVMDISDGLIRLGYSNFVGNISAIGNTALLEDHIIRDSRYRETPPREVRAADLTLADVGSLVTVRGLTFIPGATDIWASRPYSYSRIYTEIPFRTPEGGTMYVSTYYYADFAWKAVPTATVSITGIVIRDTTSPISSLMLRISSPEDVVEE